MRRSTDPTGQHSRAVLRAVDNACGTLRAIEWVGPLSVGWRTRPIVR